MDELRDGGALWEEHVRLMATWDALCRIENDLQKSSKAPIHPPAALVHTLMKLHEDDCFPPVFKDDELLQLNRDINFAIGIFRWAQIAMHMDVLYDKLTQCTCGTLDADKLSDFYKFLGGHD